MIPPEWTPHRRDDGEVLGWIRPEREAWVPVDRLGRDLADPVEWLDAEEILERHGLGWLAERWWLGDRPVRITEITTDRVAVVTDEFGAAAAVGAPVERIELPWPAPARLRAQPPASDR